MTTTRRGLLDIPRPVIDDVAQWWAKAFHAIGTRLEAVARLPKPARPTHIGGVKPVEPPELLESSKSDLPTILSAAETKRMWEIQEAAERDPAAYIEACRAKAR
jgi:hypothetical protein